MNIKEKLLFGIVLLLIAIFDIHSDRRMDRMQGRIDALESRIKVLEANDCAALKLFNEIAIMDMRHEKILSGKGPTLPELPEVNELFTEEYYLKGGKL